MDDLNDLVDSFLQANVPPSYLIQDLLIAAKRSKTSTKDSELWDKTLQKIWLYLQSGVLKIDDQLLYATCFYTVLSLTEKEEFYLNEVVQMIKKELDLRSNDVLINSKTTLVVSLMYGIFQSSFLITTCKKDDSCIINLLELTINLLIQLAYDYSRNTLTVFKIISTMKKVCGTQLQNCVFTVSNQTKLLNLVNHNWENPITGVRDYNKNIFQTLISLMDETNYQVLLKEINSFYWNKAKYLMLSEMIRQYYKNMADLVDQSDWLTGLLNSLEKSGLVSAGTDMYCAILNKLNNEDQWIEMFLPTVKNVFNSELTQAIENVINYWCLATFKKFPSVIKVFENIFEETCDINKKLCYSLQVFRQGNRLGIVGRNWNSTEDYKSMVLQGIEHGDEYVRMAAFNIVCECQGKTMPSDIEYELVLNYIKNNVNSDCSVLRLSMLNRLKNFLLEIHNALILNSKHGQVDTQNLRSFLKALQELVIFNLNIKGNYQRKITSVKLCIIIWECSKVNGPKNQKCSEVSRFTLWDKRIPHIQITFSKLLMRNKQWLLSDSVLVRKLIGFLQDPSDDIRENIVNLLTNYYSTFFKPSELINHVLEEALKSIGSTFFYEISCGQSMFKLIVNILLKGKKKTEGKLGQSTFKTVEDVFTFACNELIKEHNLKRDIVESIQSGKQLHSFMDILLVVLDVCHRNKYEIILADKEILELLKCLEDISNYFALKESSSSSDFSEISDIVQQMIDNSGFTSKADEDNTKISGIHQMVLNCMWLNAKACCDLSSLVIRHCDSVTYIEKFLLIITRVLESSRHKGAIESAGAALGQAIQYLTSLDDETDISKIPHTLLKSKLKELIMEASKMASITRRGAGLSIMVHRIVSSDMKKGKPLFHYFINMILETCNCSEDLPADLHDTDIDNEKDLPKAIYIHFLTRIVVDSSLASDVIYYSPQLAKLAFDNLTSSHWQIRNAALQLYGALVPKLLGQKKASGFGEESIATVACDELRLHSPKLWIYINEQLRNVGPTCDKVLSHSVLIPILNMLANCAMRYNFSDDPTNGSSDSALLQSLIELLDSPIFTVRRLCAKSIFNIFTFDLIYDAIIQHEFVSENFLHGVLVLIGHYLKHDGTNTLHHSRLSNVRQIVRNKLSEGNHSYLCKELYESIFANIDTDPSIVTVHNTLAELDSNVHAPGIFNWAYARIKNSIRTISWNDIQEIVSMLLSRNELELCCDILHEKLEYRKEDIPVHLLHQISELLLACEYKFNSSALWRILYEISQQIELNSCTDVILEGVKTYGHSYKLRFTLPLLSKVFSSQLDENNLEYLSKIILSLCDPQTVDAEMRYIAALSNNELATAFNSLPDVIKIRTIMSAVILLQDEDEDVRNLSTLFYKNVTEASILQHPYFCMQKLLDSEFLHTVLREPKSGIQILCTDLITILTKYSGQHPTDNYNPFANDSKNIYIEVEVIQQLIEYLIK